MAAPTALNRVPRERWDAKVEAHACGETTLAEFARSLTGTEAYGLYGKPPEIRLHADAAADLDRTPAPARCRWLTDTGVTAPGCRCRGNLGRCANVARHTRDCYTHYCRADRCKFFEAQA